MEEIHFFTLHFCGRSHVDWTRSERTRWKVGLSLCTTSYFRTYLCQVIGSNKVLGEIVKKLTFSHMIKHNFPYLVYKCGLIVKIAREFKILLSFTKFSNAFFSIYEPMHWTFFLIQAQIVNAWSYKLTNIIMYIKFGWTQVFFVS